MNKKYYCESMEEATRHPLYIDCREEMITNHNARLLKQEADRHPAAGKYFELRKQ